MESPVSKASLDEVKILQVSRPEQIIPFRASFVGAYQTIFSEPPYNERFYPNEAEGILRRVLQTRDHIALLAIRGKGQVVGFGFGVPLSARADVARHMHGLIPVDHTFYLAELGVLNGYRSMGLGQELIRQRLERLNKERFSHVLLRTSAARNKATDIYIDLGFEDMGVYMNVSHRRVDGGVRSDRRLFYSKVLTR